MPCKTGPNRIPMIPSGTKQGIVTILGSDNKPAAAAASIRRTLSADMSSRQWLHQNIFPPSSPSSYSSSSHSSSSSSEEEEEFNRAPSQDEVWRSIQASNNRASRQETDRPWGSILSHKSEPSSLPPQTPYVHPLVKSRMTQRSLEICTESLGSETGSECYFPSAEDQLHFENRAQTQKEYRYDLDPYADLRVVKYKSTPPRPLPPPLPSANRLLQARREDGRLVLEAVPVSPRNNFRAFRQEGRLVLALVGTSGERVFAYDNDTDDDGGDDGKGEDFVVENKMSKIGLPEKRLMMKKFVAVGNVNAALACKEEEEDEIPVVPQSLPTAAPRVRRLIPGDASLNVYEYFWKNKSNGFGSFVGSVPSTALINPIVSSVPMAVKSKILISDSNNSNNNNSDNNRSEYENRDFMIRKGKKGEDFVTYMKGCKEPRRSWVNWEPYCIATS
ncbi:Protein FAF-like- chloroplastic [Striga hermonthica]|uniref:Protein FAF-like- chloroplastic n=1 Tax=Striga hermonthica TaxID=68872 RepID=A0A9N7MP53_STRHE|nr:Protein FAF-like- chloroplastic [Striga hermonthica]